jgi:hypothetical protein
MAQVIDRGIIAPAQAATATAVRAAGVTPRQVSGGDTFVIIGPDDPRAQRAFLELYDKAKRREV